ncbi:DUF2029 domain-containing protein [Corynebacterium sp. 3HC-13]|uniref:glycosyltransferase family 87 protein n=1 Tax=Corynebacterium poyangense TaxID=2684405 RepID=UPI001CCEB8B7|nr:glycosyltransferase family 87 protein [Corynebacterium poyangense]MBZ8177372.1 DUF2029 domain-containing protein [Corynebacterium poyangense]
MNVFPPVGHRRNSTADFAIPAAPSSPTPPLNAAIHLYGVLFGLVSALIMRGHQQPDDWSALWIAGLITKQGNTSELYRIDPQDFARWTGPVWEETVRHAEASAFPHPFVHIPFLAEVMSWLTHLMSFTTSVFLLTAISGWAIIVLLASAWNLWTQHPIPWIILALATIIMWVSEPFHSSLYLGQTSPLVFAGVAYALAAVRHKPIIAGIVLGLVSAIKLTPVLLIALALGFKSSRRMGVVALLSGMGMVIASLITPGLHTLQDWVTTLRLIGDSVQVTPVNGSLTSLLSSPLASGSQAIVPVIHHPPLLAIWLPRLLAAVLFALVLWAAYRQPHYRWPLLSVGLFSIATTCSSILWSHYLLVAVLPLCGILTFPEPESSNSSGQFSFLRAAKLIALALIPLLLPPLADTTSEMYFPWGNLIPMVGLITLLSLLFSALKLPPSPPTSR